MSSFERIGVPVDNWYQDEGGGWHHLFVYLDNDRWKGYLDGAKIF